MSIFSLRSPGALASSEYERPSLPTADQPRTWSGAGCPAVSLTSSGRSKNWREASYTPWMNSSGTPCPVIWKNPISSQAWATCAATPSGSVPSRNGAMSMTGTVSMNAPSVGSPAARWPRPLGSTTTGQRLGHRLATLSLNSAKMYGLSATTWSMFSAVAITWSTSTLNSGVPPLSSSSTPLPAIRPVCAAE